MTSRTRVCVGLWVAVSLACGADAQGATVDLGGTAHDAPPETAPSVMEPEDTGPRSTDDARPAEPIPSAPPREATPAPPLGGGYWGPLGKAPPAPEDGAWQRTSGSVILPLGILRAGAGALSVYASQTPRCESWLDGNETTCNGLRVYGYWGLGFGVAMAAAGAAFLAIGVAKGRRYAEWQRQWSFRASVRPGASDVGFRIRF